MPPITQLYTQVEDFGSAISKLQALGLQVNVEESELVYRGTAGEQAGATAAAKHTRRGCPLNASAYAQTFAIDRLCMSARASPLLEDVAQDQPTRLYTTLYAEVAVDDDAFTRCEGLMERLLELDDVDSVYTNCEGLA